MPGCYQENYVTGMRLKVAQCGDELDSYGTPQWAMGDSAAQPGSPIDRFEDSLPPRGRASAPAIAPTDALGQNSSPPLTLLEQSHVARHLALLDAQNLEIVALYQRHFNEIQRLVTSQVINCASPEQREFQKQELQREQEGARLQLQQLHELQQRKLLAHPTNNLDIYLVRSPDDAHDSTLTMIARQDGHATLMPTAGFAAQDDTDTSSLNELVLSPLSITTNGSTGDDSHSGMRAGNHVMSWQKSSTHADSTDDETLANRTPLPRTLPFENGHDNPDLPPGHGSTYTATLYSGKEKVSTLSPGTHTGMNWTTNVSRSAANQVDPDNPSPHSLSAPDVIALTSTVKGESSGSRAGERRTTANEALRLYYTARVGELRLTYQTDLVALYRELRQMRKGADEDTNARKIEALMVDIKKILVVLTRSARDELVVDEHVDELDRVEVYIQRRVHPMSQRLKVKQAIFGDQSRVPVSAARTAQRQWQRFLRRMRDQQQQTLIALPVNVSPPRRLGI
jgi:hypothetical protein